MSIRHCLARTGASFGGGGLLAALFFVLPALTLEAPRDGFFGFTSLGSALAQENKEVDGGPPPGIEGGDGKAAPRGAGMPPGGATPPDKRGGTGPIAGSYSLVGRNVNGSSYRGRVAVSQTGETFRVVWRVGSQTFVGTGILTGDVLSVAYNGGLAVYRFSPAGIKGRWATTNARRISTEDWTRQ